MNFKTGTSLVFLAACLTASVALPANAATASAAARQNVIQSERYDRLLKANRSFRQARMRRECGPIHRAATASELPRQLWAIRACGSARDLYKKGSFVETSSA